MGEITIFKDAITEKALQEIQDKLKFLPEVIKSKTEFNIIYANYQEVRKIRIAINKKAKELISSKRGDFELEKQLIIGAELKIVNILSEVEDKLKLTRETWEESERLITEKKAEEIAEKQKAEFNRQEILRVYDQAHIDNDDFDQKIIDDLAREKEAKRLRVEAEKLKQKEEELKQREKELELQEKEKREEDQRIARGVRQKIGSIAEPTAKAALELAKVGVTLGDPEVEEDGIMPMVDLIGQRRKEEINQENDDCSEFEFICPSCDFKFNVAEE